MTSQRLNKIAYTSFKVALSDLPWRTLGYKSRPKTGSLIRKLRSDWKNSLDDRVFRAFLSISTAALIKNNTLNNDEYLSLIHLFVYESPIIEAGIYETLDSTTKRNTVTDYE